jgi:hypothetical protein
MRRIDVLMNIVGPLLSKLSIVPNSMNEANISQDSNDEPAENDIFLLTFSFVADILSIS